MKKKMIYTISGVVVVLIILAVFTQMFGLYGDEQNTYAVGDTLSINMFALTGENDKTICGKNCEAEWDLLYNGLQNLDGGTFSMNDFVFQCAATGSKNLITFNKVGNYELLVTYYCDQTTTTDANTGVSTETGAMTFAEDEVYEFNVIDGETCVGEFCQCKDGSTDAYIHDSCGIPTDERCKLCSIDSPCIMEGGEPVCEGDPYTTDKVEYRCVGDSVYKYVGGVRTSLEEDCTKSGEVCKSGTCVKKDVVITGCTPGEIIDSFCNDDNNFVEATCKTDGQTINVETTICGANSKCTDEGCVLDTGEDVPIVVPDVSTKEECLAKGYKWNEEKEYCYTTSTSGGDEPSKPKPRDKAPSEFWDDYKWYILGAGGALILVLVFVWYRKRNSGVTL